MTAPISGRPCVYSALTALRKQGKPWERVIDERCGVRFAITDGTGRAIIDPSNAGLALCFDRTERTGWVDAATARQEEILARHGLTRQGTLFTKTMRFHEAVIEVGDQIHLSQSADAPLSLLDEAHRSSAAQGWTHG